ncbi:ATP-binding protein involved in chromosome partitioning [Endobacter medicaginis]|uniref:Iron-sulfur cluster carrier protein n=3 Tax=Endobacter medicaginis TaxID=1181271 RepID=A0A839US25_9PROT|nr:Mrp/NBP35 family ATP-binding protein [Endobacter medicaginis]MBB3173048.1 ATP-binding protein involved in chromosome partitioning [Endobacter medicaginis]MCX5474527.1 Mrp/NBP35 family ATP-binding protein [Endobacter medicaginis]
MSVPADPALLRALSAVLTPSGAGDIVAAGLVETLSREDTTVSLVLRVPPGEEGPMTRILAEAEAILAAQAGVERVRGALTAHRPEPPPARTPPPRLLTGARTVIAVASGKGGVGKSTTAVNLAVALARRDLRVGLLDADIYGPSLPLMLGRPDHRPQTLDGKMLPIEVWGLHAMSIGFLVEPDQALIWRGPMVMGALQQLMGDVAWPELDIMVIDLPPGTGDAQLTLAQRVSLTGAVIVSTPQDIALADARRAAAMFAKTQVPVLGLVENMSFYCCPNCGARSEPFGHGGARAEAERLGIPFLGEVPLLPDVRASADGGTPIAAAAPDGVAGLAFASLAAQVAGMLARRLA